MIIYQNQKSGFLHDVHHRDIEEVIHEAFRARIGHKVSKEEVRSWANSLAYMGKVLVDDDIPDDCGVAIEYNIPQTAKRVDFLLTGKTADQKDCLVIVELKQWETAQKTEKDAIVVTRFAKGTAEVSHPSYQAWSYAAPQPPKSLADGLVGLLNLDLGHDVFSPIGSESPRKSTLHAEFDMRLGKEVRCHFGGHLIKMGVG